MREVKRFKKEENGIALLESTDIIKCIRITEGELVEGYESCKPDKYGMVLDVLLVVEKEIVESTQYLRQQTRKDFENITDIVLQFWKIKDK